MSDFTVNSLPAAGQRGPKLDHKPHKVGTVGFFVVLAAGLAYVAHSVGDDESFFFRRAEGKLRLRATNLQTFLKMADGVDNETWQWHLGRGNISAWIETSIKDRELAAEVSAVEQAGGDDAKRRVREAIERRYTLPA